MRFGAGALCELLPAFDAGISTANLRLCHHDYSSLNLLRSLAAVKSVTQFEGIAYPMDTDAHPSAVE
jgi:hypothetical protein